MSLPTSTTSCHPESLYSSGTGPSPNRPCLSARPLSPTRNPCSESSLRIFSWNSNRFGIEKFTHLLQLCQDYSLDIVGVQEANLVQGGSRVLPGYASVSQSPAQVVYVRETLLFKVLHEFCFSSADTEVLTVQVRNFAFMFVYLRRGCISTPCQAALQLFTRCLSQFPKSVLLGDLNARSVSMGHESPNCAGVYLDKYLASSPHRVEILNNPALPTFFRAGCRPSILDLCIVSQRGLNHVQSFETLEMQISDHRPLLLDLATSHGSKESSRNGTSVTDLEALFEFRSFNLHLRALPPAFTATCAAKFAQLHAAQSQLSISERWTQIRAVIFDSARELHLCKRRQQRFRQPWMNQEILLLSRESRYDSSKRPEFRKKVLQAKQHHWHKFIESIDFEDEPAQVWRKFRASRGSPNSPHSVSDPYSTVQEIRTDFIGFCTPEIPPSPEADNFLNSLLTNDFHVALASYPAPFTLEELTYAISRGSNKSAPGPDGISYGILKLLPESVLRQLLTVLQEIYMTGRIPTALQDALQIALPKNQPGTFRPITLSATCIKTLERMVLHRIKSHLESTLPDWQFGFRESCGAADQLLRFTTYLKSQRKIKKSTVVLYLDIKKAFDRVDYALLLKKLHSVGLDAFTLRFIYSLLTQRRIFVTHKNAVSDTYTPTSGVPQGGILSPLLWNLYFADVLSGVTDPDLQAFGYADDLALAISCKSPVQAHRRMSQIYEQVRNWMASHRIQLSDSKVKSTLFLPRVHKRTREKRSHLRVKHRDSDRKIQEVERTRCYKYLGAYIDEKLNFSQWTQTIAQETRRRTQLVRRLASSMQLSRTHIERFYIGYVRGFLLYGSSIWCQASKVYRDRVLAADRAGIRMCTGALPRTPTAAVELESTIPTLSDVLKAHLLRGTTRIFHNPRLFLLKDQLLVASELGEDSTNSVLQLYRDNGLHTAPNWKAALDILKSISPHKKRNSQAWKYHKHHPWTERTLARFRMGVLPTQDWAHLLGLTPTSTCRHCGIYVETTSHLLQECPKLDYSTLRSTWRKLRISHPALLGTVTPQELQVLLNDPTGLYHLDLEEGLLKFVRNNQLFTRRRHFDLS